MLEATSTTLVRTPQTRRDDDEAAADELRRSLPWSRKDRGGYSLSHRSSSAAPPACDILCAATLSRHSPYQLSESMSIMPSPAPNILVASAAPPELQVRAGPACPLRGALQEAQSWPSLPIAPQTAHSQSPCLCGAVEGRMQNSA